MGLVDHYDGFDWDAGNRGKNWIGHKVTDDEIEEACRNEPFLIFPDIEHSEGEERWIITSKTDRGFPLFGSYTIRNGKVRPISFRKMDRKERKEFDEAIKGTS